jgi:maltose O-acetyltransferase
MNISRGLSSVVYKYFAKKLPVSYDKFGATSKKLRSYLASKMIKECGKNVNIEKNAMFASDLIIGDFSGIGIGAQLSAGVTIGSHVMMAPEVVILTMNHAFESTEKPMRLQGGSGVKPVFIEDDVWIGQRVIILPGVTLGRGTIVGAGAVVTKSFPAYSIVAGNPATLIKSRK